jgi:hypothetical protein
MKIKSIKTLHRKTCLMFWQTRSSSGMMNMISGGSAPKLDAQCLADLKANGGKKICQLIVILKQTK